MPEQRTVYLLMFDAFGQGGVARATLTLANHLADRHRVEVISLYRRREKTPYAIDPRVRLTVLRDARVHEGRLWRHLHGYPTRLRPEPSETQMSLLTDLLLRRRLSRLRPGVLVSTRPSLHLAATRFAPAHVKVVGQDHAPYDVRFANQRTAAVLREVLPRLDAYTVLTEGDARDYRATVPAAADAVLRMPNMLSWPVAAEAAPLERPRVVAAGRLSHVKGFRRLIRCFGAVADRHPEWDLRIYGSGNERGALVELVERLGLEERVSLPGHTDDLRSALAEASVFALSSHHEGFGMALVEAMSVGVPPVSFDCPRGPGELVDHGRNGLLVEDGDLVAFSDALSRMMSDPDLRRRLGREALADAAAYDPVGVLDQWEDLFARLDSPRPVLATAR
ncbi:MAG: glycosyltransferase family 4 protein [Nocardioidaceae bacterium]